MGWHGIRAELDLFELGRPALLQVLDGVEHPVVEPVPPGAVRRELAGEQRASQASIIEPDAASELTVAWTRPFATSLAICAAER